MTEKEKEKLWLSIWTDFLLLCSHDEDLHFVIKVDGNKYNIQPSHECEKEESHNVRVIAPGGSA